ncbi:MAG: AbrB/MazE/SpoVT family DNA-binding domain-containing protein [Candidatus Sungbacteria bacterium]|nr:AbrB/MazE/SpoVT family DNA-binding domain-containing protein [Candidatus Sungbacteria bacterium]
MTTKLKKWGNSLAVRLPKDMTRHLALKEGSSILVRQDKDAIIIRRQEPQDHRLIGKNDWKQFLIPAKRKKENVSRAVDTALYGISR